MQGVPPLSSSSTSTPTRPPRLNLHQLLLITSTTLLAFPRQPRLLLNIIPIIQRTPLLRLRRARPARKPRIVPRHPSAQLKLLIRRVVVAPKEPPGAPDAALDSQACFAQLVLAGGRERFELARLLGQVLRRLDGGQVCGVRVRGFRGFGGLFALREADGELAAGARGRDVEGWWDAGVRGVGCVGG